MTREYVSSLSSQASGCWDIGAQKRNRPAEDAWRAPVVLHVQGKSKQIYLGITVMSLRRGSRRHARDDLFVQIFPGSGKYRRPVTKAIPRRCLGLLIAPAAREGPLVSECWAESEGAPGMLQPSNSAFQFAISLCLGRQFLSATATGSTASRYSLESLRRRILRDTGRATSYANLTLGE
jgi:hypothetical protein